VQVCCTSWYRNYFGKDKGKKRLSESTHGGEQTGISSSISSSCPEELETLFLNLLSMWFFLSFEIYKSGSQLFLALFDEEGASQVENIVLVNKPKALFQV
jgi:hypothetical protein